MPYNSNAITPYVFIRHYKGLTGSASDWTNLTTACDAQVVSIEQRPGAANDKAVVRLPRKRLEYFNHADSGWTMSHLDEVMITMGGNAQVFGTVRNYIRKWQEDSEDVEFIVINQDVINRNVCHGQLWGLWNHAGSTLFSATKGTLPSAELVFNKGGNPNYNRCETEYDNLSYAAGGQRFWGSGQPNDTTAGFWNPITEILYLTENIFSIGGLHYKSLVDVFGSVAGVGGWSGDASSGNLTWQKAFPEMDVDGLGYGKAVEKILSEHGGFQYRMNCSPSLASTPSMKVFRTYPPYTAHQNIRTGYLPSLASGLPPTAVSLQRGTLNRDQSQRITHLIGFGAKKRYLTTVLLHPGWDAAKTSDVVASPELIDRSDKDNYDPAYADVMRRWIIPRSSHDLNSLFGFADDTFTRQTHRFMRDTHVKYSSSATDDDVSAYLTPLLFYRQSAGSTGAKKADVSWRMLDDALGVYVGGSGSKLDGNVFSSGATGTLYALYVTAVIESDTRMVSSETDSRVAKGTLPSIEKALEYGNAFIYEGPTTSHGDFQTGGSNRVLLEKPGGGFIATNPSVAWINMQSGLDQRVSDDFQFKNTIFDSGHVVFPWIETLFAVSDVLGSIHDRNIDCESVIVNRKWNFINQTTTLELSDERYR